ncbi:LytTR family DNA-binding domain-containing protein [Bacillus sp. S/N-304-OC-R1]|uniref:LytR/AlgR family response regulator transcription factor n=1 Tax=Bacillus sp. S/N-304-OC-R1 TaxID=2758034 RepID=UPI001C8D5112|nr:LytTR family DNA-binding domain-containing protein [Bacillus sp. S/N-304-OC-R1]MBY0121817.1 response regulator transcription factor [Bacillus sp. S/N-304-OC-R1]
MLRAYIVDDEPLARDELKFLLNRSKEVEIAGESDCFEEAVADISILKPDLVFLDIELSEQNGLNLAKQLEALNLTPAIVFATAYDEYALQAFELNAIDYILKPYDENRLKKTLEKVKKLQTNGNQSVPPAPLMKSDRSDKIPVNIDERIILLNYSEILYLESSEGKCTIKTKGQEYKLSETLVALEKKLNKRQFLRVHRSYIVNIDQIGEIEPWFNSTYNLIMKDKSKVPVSRTYVKELKQLIGF